MVSNMNIFFRLRKIQPLHLQKSLNIYLSTYTAIQANDPQRNRVQMNGCRLFVFSRLTINLKESIVEAKRVKIYI